MRLDQLSTSWWVWCQVMQQLNRRADLERLLRWATRKRLPGPRTTYQRQLSHTVRTLVMYKTHYPRLVRWAFRLHRLNALLNPPPRYWAKGSAKKYRLSPWPRYWAKGSAKKYRLSEG